MRILRFLLPACLLLIGASAALADGVTDPRMTMGGPGSCFELQDENSLTQQFIIPNVSANFDCPIDFEDNISNGDDGSIDIFSLLVNVTSAFTGDISCAISAASPGEPAGGSPLDVATISSPTSCTFSGSSPNFVISGGSIYSLMFEGTFAPADGSPFEITITANSTTPEPSTTLFVCIGLAALLAVATKLKVSTSNLV